MFGLFKKTGQDAAEARREALARQQEERDLKHREMVLRRVHVWNGQAWSEDEVERGQIYDRIVAAGDDRRLIGVETSHHGGYMPPLDMVEAGLWVDPMTSAGWFLMKTEADAIMIKQKLLNDRQGGPF